MPPVIFWARLMPWEAPARQEGGSLDAGVRGFAGQPECTIGFRGNQQFIISKAKETHCPVYTHTGGQLRLG